MNILAVAIEKLKELAMSANTSGIPLPLIRDSHTGTGSYTLTMFVMSFTVAIITLVGKVTHYLGEVDYNNVLWLLGLTGGFYLGRGVRKDGTKLEVDGIGKTDGV